LTGNPEAMDESQHYFRIADKPYGIQFATSHATKQATKGTSVF
jgi:hypothetical protein